jgi:hypothetical protein
MEWADTSGKSSDPERAKFRYGVGLIAPAVAWPTLLMPIEYALISQFAAFIGLYFADARAATRGWAPAWYGTYRFVLTFIVGSAIFVSLLGRAKIDASAHDSVSGGLEHRMHKDRKANEADDTDWVKLEAEEKEKLQKEKDEAEKLQKEEEKKKDADEKKGGKKSKKDKKEKEENKEGDGDDGKGDSKEKDD